MGFMDFMFGGKEETANPMRHWAEVGPSAVGNYYDQAILDSVRQYEQYWSVWEQQMAAVDQMFAGSTVAYDRMYESTIADLDGQWSQANKQFDKQVADIRKQEEKGQGALTRKQHASGLVGTTAGRDWKAGLEDRANDAVGDVEDRRADARAQVDRAKLAAEAQRAMGMAETDRMSGASLIEVLGKAPIGASAPLELSIQKAQQVYGTPWEQYAAPSVTETEGFFQSTLAPALAGGLMSGLMSGGFGNLFGGGGGGSGLNIGAFNPGTGDWQMDFGGNYYGGLADTLGGLQLH